MAEGFKAFALKAKELFRVPMVQIHPFLDPDSLMVKPLFEEQVNKVQFFVWIDFSLPSSGTRCVQHTLGEGYN